MGGCGINGQNRTCTQNWTENIIVTSKPISKVFLYYVCPMFSSENSNMQIVKKIPIAYIDVLGLSHDAQTHGNYS